MENSNESDLESLPEDVDLGKQRMEVFRLLQESADALPQDVFQYHINKLQRYIRGELSKIHSKGVRSFQHSSSTYFDHPLTEPLRELKKNTCFPGISNLQRSFNADVSESRSNASRCYPDNQNRLRNNFPIYSSNHDVERDNMRNQPITGSSRYNPGSSNNQVPERYYNNDRNYSFKISSSTLGAHKTQLHNPPGSSKPQELQKDNSKSNAPTKGLGTIPKDPWNSRNYDLPGPSREQDLENDISFRNQANGVTSSTYQSGPSRPRERSPILGFSNVSVLSVKDSTCKSHLSESSRSCNKMTLNATLSKKLEKYISGAHKTQLHNPPGSSKPQELQKDNSKSNAPTKGLGTIPKDPWNSRKYDLPGPSRKQDLEDNISFKNQANGVTSSTYQSEDHQNEVKTNNSRVGRPKKVGSVPVKKKNQKKENVENVPVKKTDQKKENAENVPVKKRNQKKENAENSKEESVRVNKNKVEPSNKLLDDDDDSDPEIGQGGTLMTAVWSAEKAIGELQGRVTPPTPMLNWFQNDQGNMSGKSTEADLESNTSVVKSFRDLPVKRMAKANKKGQKPSKKKRLDEVAKPKQETDKILSAIMEKNLRTPDSVKKIFRGRENQDSDSEDFENSDFED